MSTNAARRPTITTRSGRRVWHYTIRWWQVSEVDWPPDAPRRQRQLAARLARALCILHPEATPDLASATDAARVRIVTPDSVAVHVRWLDAIELGDAARLRAAVSYAYAADRPGLDRALSIIDPPGVPSETPVPGSDAALRARAAASPTNPQQGAP